MQTPVTRASAASQWIYCHEAAWLAPLYPKPEGTAAREGTAAHYLAEQVLKGAVPSTLINTPAHNGVIISDDMVDPVMTYVDHVRSHGPGYWVEQAIEIQFSVGKVTGTCDGASFNFNEIDGTLYIDDFKYGYAPVDVFENWQLIIYAMGVFIKYGSNTPIQRVVMSIIQPRAYHHDGPIRTWTITKDQLNEYFVKLSHTVESIHSDSRQCTSGHHCRYCDALAFCPTAKQSCMNAVDVVMNAIPDTDTPQQIAELLDVLTYASKTIQHTLDAVTARAESSILSGVPVPGYNFEPGRGKRRFIDPQQAIDTARVFGVDVTTTKPVTPAEAERRGLDKSVVNSLTVTPSTAPKLVKRDIASIADRTFNNG